MKYNNLSPEENRVIDHKETDMPFTGEYDDFYQEGMFVCRKCNAPLFSSKNKFDAGCGWPAFDENYPDSVERIPDPDGQRIEIACTNCRGHLGHVFTGEQFTEKNTRYCVKSLSIKFIPKEEKLPKVLDGK